MSMVQGEVYHCEHCACSIEVTKGANPAYAGDLNPRCCCGQEMKKI